VVQKDYDSGQIPCKIITGFKGTNRVDSFKATEREIFA
jgi:hypothetical protein